MKILIEISICVYGREKISMQGGQKFAWPYVHIARPIEKNFYAKLFGRG
jgi:hypothetical protein